MNRQQAEHILNAYVEIVIKEPDKASDALREVILDAMTNTNNYANIWTPTITYPSTGYPSIPTYKPIVTCRTEVGE